MTYPNNLANKSSKFNTKKFRAKISISDEGQREVMKFEIGFNEIQFRHENLLADTKSGITNLFVMSPL